jgi:hypothetical protein
MKKLIEIYTNDGRYLINPCQIKLVAPDGANNTIVYFDAETDQHFKIKFKDFVQQIMGTTERKKNIKQKQSDQAMARLAIQCIKNIMQSLKPTTISSVDYGAIMNYLETLEIIHGKDTK